MKKKITIAVSIIAVVIALLAVLYFTGVFSGSKSNNSPELATAPVSVESTAENSTTPENHTAEELKAEVPVEEVKSETVETEVSENALDDSAKVTEVPTPIETAEPAEMEAAVEEAPKQEPVLANATSSSDEGTTILNGGPVRVVSSMVGQTPQKPFETVVCNGVPYSWDGHEWFDATALYDDVYPPNHYVDIGEWTGEHVGF